MIEQAVRKNALAIAKAFGKATGMSLSGISRKYYGKPGFFEDFKRGKQTITIAKLNAILKAFARDWPPGKSPQWPETEPIHMSPARK